MVIYSRTPLSDSFENLARWTNLKLLSLVLFDLEYWSMAHFEGITQLCNVYSVISKNKKVQHSL